MARHAGDSVSIRIDYRHISAVLEGDAAQSRCRPGPPWLLSLDRLGGAAVRRLRGKMDGAYSVVHAMPMRDVHSDRADLQATN